MLCIFHLKHETLSLWNTCVIMYWCRVKENTHLVLWKDVLPERQLGDVCCCALKWPSSWRRRWWWSNGMNRWCFHFIVYWWAGRVNVTNICMSSWRHIWKRTNLCHEKMTVCWYKPTLPSSVSAFKEAKPTSFLPLTLFVSLWFGVQSPAISCKKRKSQFCLLFVHHVPVKWWNEFFWQTNALILNPRDISQDWFKGTKCQLQAPLKATNYPVSFSRLLLSQMAQRSHLYTDTPSLKQRFSQCETVTHLENFVTAQFCPMSRPDSADMEILVTYDLHKSLTKIVQHSNMWEQASP